MPASTLLLPPLTRAQRAASAVAGWRAATIVAATAAIAIAAGLLHATAAPAATLWLLLGAPLCEEIVFRAGLQEALLRRRPQAPAWQATLLTALLFAAAHQVQRPGLLAAATVLPALLLGALYQQQRRWLPCAALHALFNAAWLLGGLALQAPRTTALPLF